MVVRVDLSDFDWLEIEGRLFDFLVEEDYDLRDDNRE